MTNQEAFEQALEGIESQGFVRSGKQENRHFWCKYRGEHGTKCAIGWLIPDEYYSPDFEGYPIGAAFSRIHEKDAAIIKEFKELIQNKLQFDMLSQTFFEDLQDLHDDYLRYGKYPFFSHASTVAKEYNLVFPEKYKVMLKKMERE